MAAVDNTKTIQRENKSKKIIRPLPITRIHPPEVAAVENTKMKQNKSVMNQKQINKTTKMALVKEERHHLRDTPSRRVAEDAPPSYFSCTCLRIPMCNVYLCLSLCSLSFFVVFVIVFVFVLH